MPAGQGALVAAALAVDEAVLLHTNRCGITSAVSVNTATVTPAASCRRNESPMVRSLQQSARL